MIEDTQNEAVESAETGGEETVAQAPAANLTLSDLANLKQIIEVVSQRGAFRPDEMQVVGATYTKLATFLASIAPQAQAEATEEASEEAEA